MENILSSVRQNFTTIIQFSIWILTIIGSFVFPPSVKFAGNEESVLRFSQFFVAAVIGFLILILRSYSSKKYKRIWLKASVVLFLISLIIFIIYIFQMENKTIIYPENSKNRIVIGNNYLPEVQKDIERDSIKTIIEVLSASSINLKNMDELYQIWPKDEITKNRILLLSLYIGNLTLFSLFIIILIQSLSYFEKKKIVSKSNSSKG